MQRVQPCSIAASAAGTTVEIALVVAVKDASDKAVNKRHVK
jgi:hypothetical protein